jgi:hypothetical protein
MAAVAEAAAAALQLTQLAIMKTPMTERVTLDR